MAEEVPSQLRKLSDLKEWAKLIMEQRHSDAKVKFYDDELKKILNCLKKGHELWVCDEGAYESTALGKVYTEIVTCENCDRRYILGVAYHKTAELE